MIWGVDIGVRSFYLAGIDTGGQLFLAKHDVPLHGKVKDQIPEVRWLELTELAINFKIYIHENDKVYVEEPPLAGPRNIRIFGKLNQVVGTLVSNCYGQAELVPVNTWKEKVIGKGGVNKEVVSDFLFAQYCDYAMKCDGNQNYIDAVCVALYGRSQQE